LGRLVLGALLFYIPWLTWRHSFLIIGGLIFIVVILIALFLKPNPESVGLVLIDEVEENEIVIENEIDKLETYDALKYILLSPRFWLMLIAQTSLTSVFSFNEEYVPSYLHESLGLTTPDAAFSSSGNL
jgi:sugar phosphate permease